MSRISTRSLKCGGELSGAILYVLRSAFQRRAAGTHWGVGVAFYKSRHQAQAVAIGPRTRSIGWLKISPGVPKIRGTILGVPLIRTIRFWSLY